MALDSKLRGCDLVKLKVSDVAYGHTVSGRATVLQQKTGSPVQFELTKGTRETVAAWIKMAHLRSSDYLFQSRIGSSRHISTRHYNRIFHGWIEKLDLDETLYCTYSMRRTKPYLIYKKTKNLRVIQFLLGHENSKVQFVIQASKSMMPWRYQSRLKSDLSGLQQGPCARNGHWLILYVNSQKNSLQP